MTCNDDSIYFKVCTTCFTKKHDDEFNLYCLGDIRWRDKTCKECLDK